MKTVSLVKAILRLAPLKVVWRPAKYLATRFGAVARQLTMVCSCTVMHRYAASCKSAPSNALGLSLPRSARCTTSSGDDSPSSSFKMKVTWIRLHLWYRPFVLGVLGVGTSNLTRYILQKLSRSVCSQSPQYGCVRVFFNTVCTKHSKLCHVGMLELTKNCCKESITCHVCRIGFLRFLETLHLWVLVLRNHVRSCQVVVILSMSPPQL